MPQKKTHWWLVNIGSGNGLGPSGSKPLPAPMLTEINFVIWRHEGVMIELNANPITSNTNVGLWVRSESSVLILWLETISMHRARNICLYQLITIALSGATCSIHRSYKRRRCIHECQHSFRYVANYLKHGSMFNPHCAETGIIRPK